ncbi:MAG: hypothetical protein FWD04_03615 [Conexibacteraceae bacterium]|nr:hypothetical protein [Conexibacteraceae bacterium]
MRISRSTGAVCGGLLVILGLWGGLAPLVGPYFGLAFGSNQTWHITTQRLWLSFLPGAAVIVGGLLLLRAGHRVSGTVAAWIAMAGGAWFAVGPAVSRLWDHGATPIGGPLYGTTRQVLELTAAFYGLGVVIVGVAAFALGRVVTRPAVEPSPAAPATVAEPATVVQDAPPTPAPRPEFVPESDTAVHDEQAEPEPVAAGAQPRED